MQGLTCRVQGSGYRLSGSGLRSLKLRVWIPA